MFFCIKDGLMAANKTSLHNDHKYGLRDTFFTGIHRITQVSPFAGSLISSWLPGGAGTVSSLPGWLLSKAKISGQLSEMSLQQILKPSFLFGGLDGILLGKTFILPIQLGLAKSIDAHRPIQEQSFAYQLTTKFGVGALSSSVFTVLEACIQRSQQLTHAQTLKRSPQPHVGFFKAGKDIITKNGNKALWRGLPAFAAREGTYVAGLFTIQRYLREVFKNVFHNERLQIISAGITSGLLVSVCNQPFNIIGTRTQKFQTNTIELSPTQRDAGLKDKITTRNTARLIYFETLGKLTKPQTPAEFWKLGKVFWAALPYRFLQIAPLVLITYLATESYKKGIEKSENDFKPTAVIFKGDEKLPPQTTESAEYPESPR